MRGPITGPGPVSILSTGFDLSPFGYTQQEFFISGTATSYTSPGGPAADGTWSVTPSSTAPFTTRILVNRPTDPAKFNGTVVVEWLNVSAGSDTAPDWIGDHTELMRDGFAWVGVSAQKQGVNGGTSALGMPSGGLVGADPQRYGSLSHPGDAFAYDIYSQAAEAIIAGAHRTAAAPGATIPAPLGPLVPKILLADGESQSAFFMTTYYDAIQPIDKIFNGFLVHSRGSGGMTLAAKSIADGFGTKEPFRTDLGVPVLTFTTESDLTTLGYASNTQPDSATFRDWEVAGTSHADEYTVTVGPSDDGTSNAQSAMVAAAQQPLAILSCTAPVNSGPQHWVLDAAIVALNHWVQSGKAPPSAPRLQMTTGASPTLVRDARGNAVGGIRTPAVDVPISALSGLSPPGASLICGLFGSTVPFDTATLQSLYPTHDQYVAAVTASTNSAVSAGYILAADAPELTQAAQTSSVP